MKQAFILLIGIFSLPTFGQSVPNDLHTWKPPYLLSQPTGWSTERFPFPISFAPQIPYRGVEEVRFAPGWGKARSPEYWSYLYLWWLEGNLTLTAAGLQENLAHYYTGLVAQNSKNNLPDFRRNRPATKVSLTETITAGRKAFSGTIAMLDYMSHLPLKLNCLIRVIACPQQKRTAVLVEVSPQVRSHAIWDQFRMIETSFTCNKK